MPKRPANIEPALGSHEASLPHDFKLNLMAASAEQFVKEQSQNLQAQGNKKGAENFVNFFRTLLKTSSTIIERPRALEHLKNSPANIIYDPANQNDNERYHQADEQTLAWIEEVTQGINPNIMDRENFKKILLLSSDADRKALVESFSEVKKTISGSREIREENQNNQITQVSNQPNESNDGTKKRLDPPPPPKKAAPAPSPAAEKKPEAKESAEDKKAKELAEHEHSCNLQNAAMLSVAAELAKGLGDLGADTFSDVAGLLFGNGRWPVTMELVKIFSKVAKQIAAIPDFFAKKNYLEAAVECKKSGHITDEEFKFIEDKYKSAEKSLPGISGLLGGKASPPPAIESRVEPAAPAVSQFTREEILENRDPAAMVANDAPEPGAVDSGLGR